MNAQKRTEDARNGTSETPWLFPVYQFLEKVGGGHLPWVHSPANDWNDEGLELRCGTFSLLAAYYPETKSIDVYYCQLPEFSHVDLHWEWGTPVGKLEGWFQLADEYFKVRPVLVLSVAVLERLTRMGVDDLHWQADVNGSAYIDFWGVKVRVDPDCFEVGKLSKGSEFKTYDFKSKEWALWVINLRAAFTKAPTSSRLAPESHSDLLALARAHTENVKPGNVSETRRDLLEIFGKLRDLR